MTTNNHEWKDSDMQAAKDKLYDAIWDGKPWDENFEGHRLDMLVEIESIMMDKEYRSLCRIRDCMEKHIKNYCNDEVNCDHNRYCEVSDDYLDEAA